MDISESVYPGGYYTLMRFLERRERPFVDAASALPDVDVDLAALNTTTVHADLDQPLPENKCHIRHKLRELDQEFDGGNALHLLHAQVIAQLRRRNCPPQARTLFLRMWREQGTGLAKDLSARWLISAATTFGDHGDTIEQRLGGQGLSMLFDLIKLHDSERRVSGRRNDRAFPRVRGAKPRDELAFGLEGYSLKRGDLDRHMLSRLWRYCEKDATLRPLGFRMLKMVMTDRRTIFARMQRYKSKGRSNEQ